MSGPVSFKLGETRDSPHSLDALDLTGVRIANGLQDVCAQNGAQLRIVAQPAKFALFGDWKAQLPPHVAIARYRIAAWRGGLIISFPAALVADLVDACYGGSGASTPAPRKFTATEIRFFERLARSASSAMANAWYDAGALHPEYVGCDTAAAEVVCGRSGDGIVVQRFAIDGHGPIEILYPAASLRNLQSLVVRDSQTDEQDGQDPLWRQRLSDAVMQSRLPVRTVIARPTVPLEKLMRLAPGDVIPVCLPAQVPMTVAGRLLAHGTIGEANGRAAIKISKLEQGGVF